MNPKFFVVYSLLIILMAFVLGYTLPHSPVVKYKATDYFFCGGNGTVGGKDVTVKLNISQSAPGGVIPNGNHKLELTFENMTWDKYEAMCHAWSTIQEQADGH